MNGDRKEVLGEDVSNIVCFYSKRSTSATPVSPQTLLMTHFSRTGYVAQRNWMLCR